MKAFKTGLIYFLKTQLMITIVFNLVLVILYFFIFYAVFGMVEIISGKSIDGSTAAEFVYLIIPLLIFFVFGLYYTQKKKPGKSFSRYVPIVFPIIVILFSWLFYTKIYVSDNAIPLISLPYNWVYYSFVGFLLSESTEVGNSDIGDILIVWVLPLASYVSFLAGYILGERHFTIRFLDRLKGSFKHRLGR